MTSRSVPLRHLRRSLKALTVGPPQAIITVATTPSATVTAPPGPSFQALPSGPSGPAPSAPTPVPVTDDPDDTPLSLLIPLREPQASAGRDSSASAYADRVLWERDDLFWGHGVPRVKRSCAWAHVLPKQLASVCICWRKLNARALRGAPLRSALTLGRQLCPRCSEEFRKRLARGGPG